ncbi:GTP cyclohydrolase I FolE2 [Candidatus Micrarchaeota archaeon]|nr:GTP cyclohydrolase I FolE2 [Candidatus Micrarchaeota archaeon]
MGMEESELFDVHESVPGFKVSLSRVGVTGISKRVIQESESGERTVLHAVFDAFVDLDSERKGSHLSRHNEVINEAIERAIDLKADDTEILCSIAVRGLLEKHEHASRAEVRMTAQHVKVKSTPSTNTPVQENYVLLASAVASRDSSGRISVRKSIGAQAHGITVCPCSMELSREYARKKLSKQGFTEKQADSILEIVPLAAHNQRSLGMLAIETSEGERVDADDLIDVVEESMSSSVYEILKRPDEQKIVLDAHANPVFVEDCVRRMLERVLKKFDYLPDDSIITARQTNFESVHSHNAFAEKTITLGELRNEADKNELSLEYAESRKEKHSSDVGLDDLIDGIR